MDRGLWSREGKEVPGYVGVCFGLKVNKAPKRPTFTEIPLHHSLEDDGEATKWTDRAH